MELPARPTKENGTCPHLESAHYRMAAGYHAFRSRGTSTALLFFTVAGEGFFRSGRGGVYVTRAHELMLYAPEAEQEYGTLPAAKRWDFHWVHFHARAHWAPWLAFEPVRGIRGLRRAQPTTDAAELVSLFQALHRDVRRRERLRAELAMNTLERLLLLVREGLGTASRPPLDPRVQGAVEAIAADPLAGHTVASLARAARLSPSRFAHLFREQTGKAVLESVMDARMNEAEKLLRLTGRPIAEIAYSLGFYSPGHFAARFLRRHGQSPRAYRRAASA